MKNAKDLILAFPHYFEILIADTPELMKKIHQMRYEVFCKEFHFEREEDCPDGLEKDEYDAQSTHCLIIHRSSQQPAACVRLIHTLCEDPNALLPIERYCNASFYPGDTHPSRLPRAGLCEFSRLAISRQFRKRRGEDESPVGIASTIQFNDESGYLIDEREYRIFPILHLALCTSMLSISLLTQQSHGLAVVEPWLGRQLQIIGISFRQIGKVADYHGARVPFHYKIAQGMADKERRPILGDLFDLVDPILEAEARRVGLIQSS